MFDSLYECYVAQCALCEVSLDIHNIFGAASASVIRQHKYYKILLWWIHWTELYLPLCMPNMPQTMENVKQYIHIITEISITEQFLSVLKESQYYKNQLYNNYSNECKFLVNYFTMHQRHWTHPSQVYTNTYYNLCQSSESQ